MTSHPAYPFNTPKDFFDEIGISANPHTIFKSTGLDSAGMWRTIPDHIEDEHFLKKGKNQKNAYSLNPQNFGRLILPAKLAVTANSTVCLGHSKNMQTGKKYLVRQ